MRLAMSLAGEPCTTTLILATTYRFEMGWVHARRISTEVVEFEMVGNRPVLLLVRKPVSKPNHSAAVDAANEKTPVPERATGGGPFPTTAGDYHVDFVPKSGTVRSDGRLS